jgi:hypothetical protein
LRRKRVERRLAGAGTQFTCFTSFTGAKELALIVQKYSGGSEQERDWRGQVLSLLALLTLLVQKELALIVQKYSGGSEQERDWRGQVLSLLALLALLVQKYRP